jgi:NADH-quinone oxidoreductase subunit F
LAGATGKTPGMSLVHRVLFPSPIQSLDEYFARGGGEGLEAARKVDPETLISELEASGLRGRGGAGFPTGTKWRTVRANRADVEAATVVVNGAEGEPGTFKDRTILRNDPYQVVEGALIAARAVGATQVVVALKRSFHTEAERVQRAIDEMTSGGLVDGVDVSIFLGPGEYLYGEETALLETIDGRYPLPRIAPPFRRGVDEVVADRDDVASESGLSAHVVMAGPEGSAAAPTLVDNVETLANVPRIIARGASWFRTEGTDKSPGTIVCTVTGATRRHGVGEVVMGTPLAEVIEAIGGGPRPGHRIKAVLPGVSNAAIPGSLLDTPVSYEGLAAIGSGLGSAGFIVLDDSVDMTAVAAGVSRFLAVESCGQCTPCKQDGRTLAEAFERLCRDEGDDADVAAIRKRIGTVGDRARCALATQHQVVVGSIADQFAAEISAHAARRGAPVAPELVAELVDIEGDEAVVDEHHRLKQYDWTFDEVDSGKSPADRLGEHRGSETLED